MVKCTRSYLEEVGSNLAGSGFFLFSVFLHIDLSVMCSQTRLWVGTTVGETTDYPWKDAKLGPTKVDEHGIGKNVVFIGKGYRLFENVSSRKSIPRKGHDESVLL